MNTRNVNGRRNLSSFNGRSGSLGASIGKSNKYQKIPSGNKRGVDSDPLKNWKRLLVKFMSVALDDNIFGNPGLVAERMRVKNQKDRSLQNCGRWAKFSRLLLKYDKNRIRWSRMLRTLEQSGYLNLRSPI